MSRPTPYMGFNGDLTASEGFIKNCDVIGTGAIFSSVQSSYHIRARSELECNGRMNPRGYLQDFDLKTFENNIYDMRTVLEYIKTNPFFEHNSGIVYRFFHFSNKTESVSRVIHGVLLTDSRYQLVHRFDRCDLGLPAASKSISVLDFCQKHISNPAQLAA